MYLSHLRIKNHPILGDLDIPLINKRTGKPYSIVAFVGENGCGKTTLLNEIFNYRESEYFYDKESPAPIGFMTYSSLFLRQSSLARNAMKEIGLYLDGKERYPSNSGSHILNGKTTNPMTDKKQGLELLEALDDAEIYSLFKDGVIGEVKCGSEIVRVINGQKPKYDISNYSSGQQEILLKLKDLQEYYFGTDSVLLDEPETSLHPRWQKEIVNLVIKLLTDVNNNVPQIFLATHSEKVLESLISRDDALIVRLYKEHGAIKTETIDNMHMCLSSPTFGELDYLVFHIPSMDYHDQLLTKVAESFETEAIYYLDKAIRNHHLYSKERYEKEWIGTTIRGVVKYKTLPVYIRNYFHHPKEGKAPTEEEIVKSILFLRDIIKEL